MWVFGVPFVAVGLCLFVIAAVPRWRSSVKWKGTRTSPGAISGVGLGLAFTVGGVFFSTRGWLDDDDPNNMWFAMALFASFLIAGIGQLIDFRFRREDATDVEPGAAPDGGGM
jgi:hypothetical protein